MRNELRRLSSETVNGTSLAALRFPAQKGVYHCLTRESLETAKKNVADKLQRYSESDGSGARESGLVSPALRWWKAPAAAIMAALSVQ